MVMTSKRKHGQLVQCTQCHTEKPWCVGVDAFKSEKGQPRQPCSKCDTAQREMRRKQREDIERVNATKRMQRWREKNPEKYRDEWLKPRNFN